MGLLTQLTKAAAPLIGAIGIAGQAQAQAVVDTPEKTLTPTYVANAIEAAKTACPNPLPADQQRTCARGVFEAQTKLYAHWRNSLSQYYTKLPQPIAKEKLDKLQRAAGHADGNCGDTRYVIDAAKKTDQLSTELLDVIKQYQVNCSIALDQNSTFLEQYKIGFRTETSHFETLAKLLKPLTPTM